MVHVIQYLCEHRHCLMGAAYEDDYCDAHEAQKRIQEMFIKMGADANKCRLCNSTQFHFEDKATGFATMREAAPSLGIAIMANAQARRRLGQLFDAERN